METLSRDGWPIDVYWADPAESAQRVSQNWFIRACLLTSAVQDYYTGVALGEDGHLNWAVTCRYYSMVHVARLLLFQAVGDFPTGHQEMARAFTQQARPNVPTAVKCDWLRRFESSQGASVVEPRDIEQALLRGLSASGDCAAEARLKTFGSGLEKLCALRNDSNYESLLIGQQHNHEWVSEFFAQLVSVSDCAAREALDLAISIYRLGLSTDALFEGERLEHQAASDAHVRFFLLGGFASTLDCHAELKQNLCGTVDRLRFATLSPPELDVAAQEIEGRVRMSLFEGKQRLFGRSGDKLQSLKGILIDRA